MKDDQPRAALPFACTEVALLRSPMLPAHRSDQARAPELVHDPDESRLLIEYVRRLAGDPVVREAVELSSPALGALVSRIVSGVPLKLKVLRRAALSLTRYQLRMAARPT